MESHYCRKETSKYYLLPEWTSKKALYDYYVSDWCSSNNIPPLSVAKFNNTLESEKISLFHPKKDACEKCMSFKLGFVPEDEHKFHITKKDEARAEKDNDKNQEDNNIVFAVDVQALLAAPKSNVSSLYYKSKLNVHNFCAFNLKTKEAYCFLWNEKNLPLFLRTSSWIKFFLKCQQVPCKKKLSFTAMDTLPKIET